MMDFKCLLSFLHLSSLKLKKIAESCEDTQNKELKGILSIFDFYVPSLSARTSVLKITPA